MICKGEDSLKTFILDTCKSIKMTTLTKWAKTTSMSYYCNEFDIPSPTVDPYKYHGIFVDNENDKFGIIPDRDFNPIVYRGVNHFEPEFIPSAKRYNLRDPAQKLEYCVQWIKRKEFIELFKLSPYYSRCTKFNVCGKYYEYNLEAVAQHYGFMSNYLDVTRNINTALFFAYTYFDNELNAYRPLMDFKKRKPFLYSANIRTYTDDFIDKMVPISLQLLPRPLAQKAIAINVDKIEFDDLNVKIIRLPESNEISTEIFYRVHLGRDCYPKQDLLGTVADRIKKRTRLFKPYLEDFCKEYNCKFDEYSKKLSYKNYLISDSPLHFEQQSIDKMNEEIDEIILPYLDKDCDYKD